MIQRTEKTHRVSTEAYTHNVHVDESAVGPVQKRSARPRSNSDEDLCGKRTKKDEHNFDMKQASAGKAFYTDTNFCSKGLQLKSRK